MLRCGPWSGLTTSTITSPSPPGWPNSSRGGASRSPSSCLSHTLAHCVLLENRPNSVHKFRITHSSSGPLPSCFGGSSSRCNPSRCDQNRRVLSASLNPHPQSSSTHPMCPLYTLQSMHKPHSFGTTFSLHHRTALHLLPSPLHHPAAPAPQPPHALSIPSHSQNWTDRWRSIGSSKM